MKPFPALPRLGACALLVCVCASASAQMNTPSHSGPPSTQPPSKSPSKPASGESLKDVGGPQITVPLKKPAPVPPSEAQAASGANAASKPVKPR